MSVGEFAWILFLGGLPFAPFLDRRLDLWHGQGLWAALWIGVLFCLSLMRGYPMRVGNKPLAAWLLLSWVWTCWTFTQALATTKQYPLIVFIPFLHILSIIGFYLAAKAWWDQQLIKRLLTTLALSGVVVISYGLFQASNIDPIFKDLEGSSHEIVGLIGNPSHFGTYLAVLLPVYWYRPHWTSRLAQGGLWGLLLLLLLRKASVAGFVSAMSASMVWWSFKRPRVAWGLGVGGILLLGLLFWQQAHVQQILSDSGRLKAWGLFAPLIGTSPLWGIGPGALAFLSSSTTGFLKGWRHCHNEYLQLLIEQGLVGISLLAWLGYETMRRITHMTTEPLLPIFASMLTAFAVSAMISYPAHLWMIGALGLFAFCAIEVLSETPGCR